MYVEGNTEPTKTYYMHITTTISTATAGIKDKFSRNVEKDFKLNWNTLCLCMLSKVCISSISRAT